MRGQFVLYEIDFLNVNQPKLDLVWIKQWQLNKTVWIYWALLRLVTAQSEITRTERNARHSKSSKEHLLFAKQRYKSGLLSISIQYFILCPWADVNRFERLVYILLALEPGPPVIDFFLLSDNWNCKIVPLGFQAQTSAAGDSSSNYYKFNPVSNCLKDYNLLKCQDGRVDAGPPGADGWPRGLAGHGGAGDGHSPLARQTARAVPAADGGRDIAGKSKSLYAVSFNFKEGK